MAPLTPADVKHWDADAIHSVFQTATDRVHSLQKLGDNLDQVHNKLSEWQGEAGDAFRADLGKTRRDIEADGHETKQVAAAVSRAETDVRAVKSELDRIEQAAQADGLAITSDWRVDSGSTKLDGAQAVIKEHLQGMLDACKLHAHNADQELAAAVRSAVTAAPAGTAGAEPGGDRPKSWQDMVLPTGPGSGDGAKGPPVPADSAEAGRPPSLQDMLLGPGTPAGGKPPSVEDMLLGRGTPAGQKPPEGDPLDILSRIPAGATAIPAPPLKPEAIESLKAMARQTMINDGVPADQIEGRLNAIVANTQQWLDAGAPNYVAPEGPKPPPPGLAEGFADRWFSTEQGIKELFGQGGPGSPGVLQSWGQMLKGTVENATNPVGAVSDEIQHAINSPSLPYYLGEKGADVAMNAPMMMFGGEGAALKAGLGDVSSIDVYAGMSHPPNLPIGLENPTSYHPWSESAAQDLYSAFAHGEPTAGLTRHLSDMVTHYVGDDPDRVVLGKWEWQDGGYIGEARGNGGIFFDTGDPAWKALADGLDKQTEQAVVWPVNEQFLRTQMENEIGRIDYILDRGEYGSLEDMAEDRPTSYSAYEVNFLNEVAGSYGYKRVGDSWILQGGSR